MELEIDNAFVKAGISETDAKAAVDSISKEIDKRYSLHAQQLATRGDVEKVGKDMAEMEARLLRAMSEMQRWTLTTMFAAIGALAVFLKFFT
jgi:multidrug resistance efflux pump